MWTFLWFAFTLQAAPVPGEFVMDLLPDKATIRLTRSDTFVDPRRTLTVSQKDLIGFRDTDVNVRFQVRRLSGTFLFEGVRSGTQVAGEFRFVEDPAYVQKLRTEVPNWYDPSVAFHRALPATPPSEAESAPLNFGLHPNLLDRTRMKIHNVSPELLRELRLSGYDSFNTNDVLKLNTHGVTDFDLLIYRTRGLGNLSADDIVKLKTQGLK